MKFFGELEVNFLCSGTGTKKSVACSYCYKFTDQHEVPGMEEQLGDKARKVGRFQGLRGP